jgi:hypothetical protein
MIVDGHGRSNLMIVRVGAFESDHFHAGANSPLLLGISLAGLGVVCRQRRNPVLS